MNLKNIMLMKEARQKKSTCCTIPFTWNFRIGSISVIFLRVERLTTKKHEKIWRANVNVLDLDWDVFAFVFLFVKTYLTVYFEYILLYENRNRYLILKIKRIKKRQKE